MGLSLNGIKHAIAQPIGWAAEGAGKIQDLAPGGGSSTLTNAGKAITNPNVVFTGSLNPLSSSYNNAGRGNGSPLSAFAPVAGSGGQVKSAAVVAPGGAGQQPGVVATGANGANGGSAGAYDPDKDPALLMQHRNQLRSMMDQFKAAAADVIGQIDALAKDKEQQFIQAYDTQQHGLDTQYGTTASGIDNQFSARNTFNSSDRLQAQQEAKDAYDTATQGIGQSRESDLAGVGSWAGQQKASVSSGTPNFDPNNYSSVNDLLGIEQDVNGAIGKLGETRAGLGTNGQNLQTLNGIVPKQETGTATLQAQLTKLAGTNASPDAKRAIAATTIANSGADPKAWGDFFEQQLMATGSGAASPSPTGSVLTTQ